MGTPNSASAWRDSKTEETLQDLLEWTRPDNKNNIQQVLDQSRVYRKDLFEDHKDSQLNENICVSVRKEGRWRLALGLAHALEERPVAGRNEE